jgi:hypothetical protein
VIERNPLGEPRRRRLTKQLSVSVEAELVCPRDCLFDQIPGRVREELGEAAVVDFRANRYECEERRLVLFPLRYVSTQISGAEQVAPNRLVDGVYSLKGVRHGGLLSLCGERNGSRAAERLPEPCEHDEARVNPDAIKAASAERGKPVLVLEPAELALNGSAALYSVL